jgi:hypothetical protein
MMRPGELISPVDVFGALKQSFNALMACLVWSLAIAMGLLKTLATQIFAPDQQGMLKW